MVLLIILFYKNLSGKIFSCFMASCLLGSTAFGALQKKGVTTENTALGMMIAATSAMGLATAAVRFSLFYFNAFDQ